SHLTLSVYSLLSHFPSFLLLTPRPPRSTLFPTRRSSDLTSARPSTSPGNFTELRGFPMALPSSIRRLALVVGGGPAPGINGQTTDRKSTRLNSSHVEISYAVFCLKKKKHTTRNSPHTQRS